MHSYHILGFIYSFICIFACVNIAGRENRNQFLAGILGMFFGVFAVFGYWIAGNKELPAPYSDKPKRRRNKSDW